LISRSSARQRRARTAGRADESLPSDRGLLYRRYGGVPRADPGDGVIVGIDPGSRGAWVALSRGRIHGQRADTKSGYYRRPVRFGQLIGARAHSWGIDLGGSVAYLEQPATARAGHRRQSTIELWREATRIATMLQIGGVRVVWVRPHTWRAGLGLATRGDVKGSALDYVRREIPRLDLTPGQLTRPHDGLVDAACLAHWGAVHAAVAA